MKKIMYMMCAFFCTAFFFAQTPQKTESELQKQRETVLFGLESEVIELIDGFIRSEDKTFANDIYSVFEKTQNTTMREKIIHYFTAIKEERIKNYVIDLLNEPYDTSRSVIFSCLKYSADLNVKESIPAIKQLLKNDTNIYFEPVVNALSKIGGAQEAVFLAEYLNEELTVGQKQTLVRALGQLQAVETWDTLSDLAQNTDENSYTRAFAAEAIGNMKKEESVPILLKLFNDTDIYVRAAVVSGLSNYNTNQVKNIVVDALKDNQARVRMEAVNAALKLKIGDAVPTLMYRAKNDPDTQIRYKSIDALSEIGTQEAVDFLILTLEDKKVNEATRARCASTLLQNHFNDSVKRISAAASETLKDDRTKNLRYALGKEFAKYNNSALAGICSEYLAHTDVSTKGTGLDIFAKNFFSSVMPIVQSIAANPKDANSKKAKLILERGKQ